MLLRLLSLILVRYELTPLLSLKYRLRFVAGKKVYTDFEPRPFYKYTINE